MFGLKKLRKSTVIKNNYFRFKKTAEYSNCLLKNNYFKAKCDLKISISPKIPPKMFRLRRDFENYLKYVFFTLKTPKSDIY